MSRRVPYLEGLVRELVKLPRETEWLEFKENNDHPVRMGEHIAALANAAALSGKSRAYLIFGVRDADRAVVGTHADPKSKKRGGEELEAWLLRKLTPRIDFRFGDAEVDGQRVLVVQIDAAAGRPVAFDGEEYIRIGSEKRRLKDFPEKEKQLWAVFDRRPFEAGVAVERMGEFGVYRGEFAAVLGGAGPRWEGVERGGRRLMARGIQTKEAPSAREPSRG